MRTLEYVFCLTHLVFIILWKDISNASHASITWWIYWRILNWNVLWDLLLGSWGWLLEVVVGEFVVGFPPNSSSGAGVENSSNMKAETVSERLLLQFLFTQLSWYLVGVWIVCFTPNFGHSYAIVIWANKWVELPQDYPLPSSFF